MFLPICSNTDRDKLIHVDGLVQERRNSSVLAMELRLSWTNPSTYPGQLSPVYFRDNLSAWGRHCYDFECVIVKYILVNDISEIAIRETPQDHTDDKSPLIQAIAWCHPEMLPYCSCWHPAHMFLVQRPWAPALLSLILK